MKMRTMILMAVLASLFSSSCKKVTGEGPVVTETRPLHNFSSLSVSIGDDVYYVPDNIFSVQVRAQQNILDVLETTVRDGELQIFFRNVDVGRHDRIEVIVHAPDLNGLTLSGSGNLKVAPAFHPSNLQLQLSGSGSIIISDLVTEKVTARMSGSGNINLQHGTAERAELDISGSGGMDFLNFPVRMATVHISGSGNARLDAGERLDVDISGSGTVWYKGNPDITQNVSGSGKVKAW